MTGRFALSPERRRLLRFAIPALLATAAILCARIRLLDAPLERDEGEYAYVAQLILRGLSPFAHAYTMKLPGTGAVYALFLALFGQTATAIRIALLTAGAASTFLLHRLVRDMYGRRAAIVAAAVFVVLSASQSVLGTFAHATQFVLPFALGGFLLLDRFPDARRDADCILGGLCLGLAVLMKQHAAVLVAYAAARLALAGGLSGGQPAGARIRQAALMLAGSAVPYALVCAWMAASGTFGEFWFWTVRYAARYATLPSLENGWAEFAWFGSRLFEWQFPMLGLAIAGLVAAIRDRRDARPRAMAAPLPLLAASLLSMTPGLRFFPHYFVLLLPAAATLAGLAILRLDQYVLATHGATGREAVRAFAPWAAPALFAALLGGGILSESDFLFRMTPVAVSRSIYGLNPFPEAIPIADYIRRHSAPDDRVAVFGSEPEILFYSRRLSATGTIYMYGLMEEHAFANEMQQAMIREIETTGPRFFVTVKVPSSWLGTRRSDPTIMNWVDGYLAEHYTRVGIAELEGDEGTVFRWDDAAAAPTSAKHCVELFMKIR